MSDTYSIPGMAPEVAQKVRDRLQQRLVALIDLELTLKHIHWNVVGPNFIGVHEMLDPQVASVREMIDEIAERIATLGGSPVGTPGFVSSHRSWDDYPILRATTLEHLGALDIVYRGVVADHRSAIGELEEPDPVTQGLLIEQSAKLEQYQWFVRAHLEDRSGTLSTEGAHTLADAASQASGGGRTTKKAQPAKKAARKRS